MSAEDTQTEQPPTTSTPATTAPSTDSTEPSTSPITASDNSDSEPAVPHPLHRSWTFWFSKPSTSATWGSALKQVTALHTAEQLWSLLNAIKQPSQLQVKHDYYLFHAGIAPEWEDAQNKYGGKWTVMLPRTGSVDTAWLHTVLAAVGEQFSEGEELCGIVLSPRAKEVRLSLWTRNAKDEGAQRRLGAEWKAVLGDSISGRLEYQSHEDAMASGTSYRTPTSYVL